MSATARAATRGLAPLLLGAVLLVTACAQNPPELPSSANPTPQESQDVAGGDEPDKTAEPGTPLGIECADLVDADAVYQFNPGLALLGEFDPEAGTLFADAVAAQGLACRWVTESNADVTMDVAAALLSDQQVADRAATARGTGEAVSAYGDEAYFEIAEGMGTVNVFQDRFWLVIASPMFAEPSEPASLIQSALDAFSALSVP